MKTLWVGLRMNKPDVLGTSVLLVVHADPIKSLNCCMSMLKVSVEKSDVRG